MSRLALVLVLPALLLGLLVTPAEAAAPSRAERYAAAAHHATNQQGAERGLRELRSSRCLARLALRQAERMASAGALSHQDLDPVLVRCGLRSAGENVAYGFASGRSVVDAGWMPSPGHRANLLATGFRVEGIAAVRGAGGTWWVAQVFGRRA